MRVRHQGAATPGVSLVPAGLHGEQTRSLHPEARPRPALSRVHADSSVRTETTDTAVYATSVLGLGNTSQDLPAAPRSFHSLDTW